MSQPETTSWRLIQQAAAGVHADRLRFAQIYQPAVRAFLLARWRNSLLLREVSDAIQEVFVECFRSGGVLQKADPQREGGFRAFFYGVLRNVAMRFEQRAARRIDQPAAETVSWDNIKSDGDSLSQVFDRAWASAVIREAAARQAETAKAKGEGALRRVELLRLRFQEGLPIRVIARQWQVDAAFLHHEYATARKEYAAALREVVAKDAPPGAAERVLAQLLETLG